MRYPKITISLPMKRFNPETGEIEELLPLTAKRDLTEMERQRYRSLRLQMDWRITLAMIVLLLPILSLPFLVAFAQGWAHCIGWIVSIIGGGGLSIWLLNRRKPYQEKLEELLDKAKLIGFKNEYQQAEDNLAFVELAQSQWDSMHSLEVKIRKAIATKNCVDIAEVIREMRGE